MTHDELLAKIEWKKEDYYADDQSLDALRAVVELHKIILVKHLDDTDWYSCQACGGTEYPCETIEAIEKELK